MNELANLKATSDNLHAQFQSVISAAFPGADEWHWYRALAHIDGHNSRRNDDTSRDADMAAHEGIKTAHDNYISALHEFYQLRDGPHGVLGRFEHEQRA